MNGFKRTPWILAIGLVACGNDGTGDAWWNVSTTQPWTDEGGGPTDGDHDDEGEDEPYRALFGEFELSGGAPTTGWVGYYWNRGPGDVVCDFEFPATANGTADCAACGWAVVVDLGQAEFSEQNGDCEPYASWAGTRLELGAQGDQIAYRPADAPDWTVSGFTETEGSQFFFEVELD